MKFLRTKNNDFIPLNAITEVDHDELSPTPLCWVRFGEGRERSVKVPAEVLTNEIVLFAEEKDADFLNLNIIEENYQASLVEGPQLVDEPQVDEEPTPEPTVEPIERPSHLPGPTVAKFPTPPPPKGASDSSPLPSPVKESPEKAIDDMLKATGEIKEVD